MKRRVALLPLLLPACLLVSCNRSDPGTPSRAEAQQLDDAAAALDANSIDINAVAPNATAEDQPQ